MEQKNSTNEIEIEQVNDNFTITVKGEFRNYLWSQRFGEIQEKLDNEYIENIIVNLTEVTWIDPLPIMSMILTLVDLKIQNNNINVEFHLLIEDKSSIFLLKYEFFANAVENYDFCLKLGHSEGFYFVTRKLPKMDMDVKTLLEIKNILKESQYKTMMGESHVLDVQIADFREVVKEQESVNTIIQTHVRDHFHQQILSNLQLNIEPHRLDETIYRLETILVEFLTNSFEHAYESGQAKLSGIFIRYRVGGENVKKVSIRNAHKLAAKKEDSDRVGLKAYFSNSTSDFIEIFIIDNGRGLAKNYFTNDEMNKSPSKNFFQLAFKAAFISGTRGKYSSTNLRNDIEKGTFSGGLNFINNSYSCDFICCRGLNRWVHTEFPQHINTSHSLVQEVQIPVKGFGAILRLDWQSIGDNEWKKIDTDIFRNEYASRESFYSRRFGKTAGKLVEELNGNQIHIVDDRFPESITSANNKLEIYLKPSEQTNLEFSVYFPAHNLAKNIIIENINNQFGSKKLSLISKTLVIGDIRPYECLKYQRALDNAQFTPQFLENYDHVVLISNRLRVWVLKKESNSFKERQDLSSKFSQQDTSIDIQPNYSDYLSFLRTHDSILLWNKIMSFSINGDVFFLTNDIRWHTADSEEVLKGYLNLQKIIDDDRLYPIIENALFRLYGFDSYLDCRSTDDLISGLSETLNTYSSINSLKRQTKINLGSVYVSGTTASSFSNGDIPSFLLFIHGGQEISDEELKQQTIYSLFLWNQAWLQRINKVEGDYERVGRTHNIAPFGWRYYPVPRSIAFHNGIPLDSRTINDYDDKDIGIDFISAYARNPVESYMDFQNINSGVFSIAHNKYGNKHDILNISYIRAVETSFRERSALSIFLLSEFLIALGATSDSIELDSSVKIIEKRTNNLDQDLFEIHQNKVKEQVRTCIEVKMPHLKKIENGLLVFPHHYSTGKIVRLIKTYISKKLHDRIIPLHPVLMNRASTSHIISSFDISSLESILENQNNRTVTLFDETIIDGSTNTNLRHIFDYLNIDNIRSLAIADRRRLPFGVSNPDEFRVYWRIDVPRLGSKDTCQICKAIENLEFFKKNSLIHVPLQKRIDTVNRIWGVSNLYEGSTSKGLEAKFIEPATKKFSIKINPKTGKKVFEGYEIKLTNSLGLSIYITELSAMTTRDDIVTYLERGKFQGESKDLKLEVLAISLLLFHKDFSNGVVYDITRRIVELILESHNNSNETAFALLALILVDEELLIRSVLNQISKYRATLCSDAKLLLLYSFVNHQNYDEDNNLYKYIVGRDLDLYLYNEVFKDQYSYTKKLIKAIYNDFGKVHDCMLHKISELKFNAALSDNKKELHGCLSESEGWLILLEKFPTNNTDSIVRKGTGDKLSIDTVVDNLEKLKTQISIALNERKTGHTDTFSLKEIIETADSAFNHIKEITKNLTVCLYKDEHGRLEFNEITEKLETLKDEYLNGRDESVSIKVLTIPNTITDDFPSNIRAPFDSILEREIEYILDNLKYKEKRIAFSDIQNYFSDIQLLENDESDMYIFVSYEKNMLSIQFLNSCNDKIDITKCQKEYDDKERPETLHLREELKGDISYEKVELDDCNFLFKTTITLPKI